MTTTTTNFQTLGRLGTAGGTLSGGTLRRRLAIRGRRIGRRGRPSLGGAVEMLFSRPALIVVGVLLLGLFALGTAAQSQTGSPTPLVSSTPQVDPALEATLRAGGTQMAADGSRNLIPGGGATAGMVEVPPAFAAVDDLALTLPGGDIASVMFSEADAADMLPLAPVGEMGENANPAYEPVETFEGPEYAVKAPITGIRPATGLAVIPMAAGAEILSPVTGTVTAVMEYSMADGGRDLRIVIAPSTRPDLEVVVRHVEASTLSVGQHVGVGQGVLGRVRNVPVAGEEGGEGPALLISVRPAISEETYDPYAPAVDATPSE